MPPTPAPRTDDELIAATDIGTLLLYGLTRDAFHTALFGDGAVAAAVTLDRLGVLPRSVAFLADTVRAGGVRYVAELSEPLPSPEASQVLRGWLRTAADVAAGPDAENRVARWLDTVAELIGARRDSRTPHQ
ncbi:hypothetical protein EJ357_21905 [Streptomyces cyaneochromogenes]|uniref:Uncharacterized protein n=1 Tax=Streptomyces cyaneochromogenes TaxID=2496836 RepID=A0A3S9M9T8_9ACTN|nr:hypothetical protein [Streptomyces cyaneochromogenes]AZQ35818.1 hypothetical protein EJ357_21905 [Streptomyces cyaneochromogenes]